MIRSASLRVLGPREEKPEVRVTPEHHKAITAAAKRMKTTASELLEQLAAEATRPKKRGDCETGRGQRPCPWVSCRHNLLVEIGEEGLIFNAGRGVTWRGAKPRGITWRATDESAASTESELTPDQKIDLAIQWWNDEVDEFDAVMVEHDRLRFEHDWRVTQVEWGIDVEVPELPPEPRMAYSCVLDVVEDLREGRFQLDDGKMLLEDIGDVMHVTRERVRQLETSGIEDLRAHAPQIAEALGTTEFPETPGGTYSSSWQSLEER